MRRASIDAQSPQISVEVRRGSVNGDKAGLCGGSQPRSDYTKISLIGCVASIERVPQLSVVKPMTC